MQYWIRAILSFTVLAASSSSALSQISCDLSGLKIGDRTFAFGSEVEMVADGLKDEQIRSLSLGKWALSMRAREIGGVVLDANDSVHIVVFGKYEMPKDVAGYRLKGEIRDGFEFGGKIRLSYLVTSSEAITGSPEISTPKNEQLVDLTKQEGKEVEIVGTLWSMNGIWLFEYNKEKVYLTNASGRSETYEVNWHGHQVRVKGLLKRQLRASLDQITQKTARDLVMHSVIIDADVRLDGESDINNEGDRFRALYHQTPKMNDGVFELLAEDAFRRNVASGETTARSFVARNWPHIAYTLKNATDASRDTISKRMNDAKTHETLRHIYASMLAAMGDSRGMNYLKELVKPGTGNKPNDDIIYLVGAVYSWTVFTNVKIDKGSWLEELALHCLKVSPGKTVVYSSIPKQLCETRSKDGIDFMIKLMMAGTPKIRDIDKGSKLQTGEGDDIERVDMSELSRMIDQMDINPAKMSPADYASAILQDVLATGSEFVKTDDLIKLTEKFPEPDYNRRLLFIEMLKRDEPLVIDHFLDDLEEDFWSMDLDEYAGPKIIAAVREKLPSLKPGEVRSELELLLLRRSENAAANFAKMLEDPETPSDDLNKLSWELARIDGGKRHAASIARVIRNRLFKNAQKNPSAMTVTLMIERVGESSELGAVKEMIALLGEDFSVIADEWVSVQEFQHHIAGQLAEMTGESFGVDQGAWEKWFAQKTK